MSAFSKYISVDWGTSNFRASVVNGETLEILESCSSPHGVKSCYEDFKKQSKLTQQEYFIDVLLKELSQLKTSTTKMPIITSGMASSSLGIVTLDYSDFPIYADGSNLRYKSIAVEERNLIVISGAKDAVGFMRGEEVQAIGLSKYLDQTQPCILVLPGTHSKHLMYEDGKFHSMKNFMTGELYQVLSVHSILSYSLQQSTFDSKYENAFVKGLDIGSSETLTASLLNIRYEDLINESDAQQNYFLLSGILIGNELAYLKHADFKIYLGASNELNKLYSIGLQHLCNRGNVICLDQNLYEQASIAGQQKILNLYYG